MGPIHCSSHPDYTDPCPICSKSPICSRNSQGQTFQVTLTFNGKVVTHTVMHRTADGAVRGAAVSAGIAIQEISSVQVTLIEPEFVLNLSSREKNLLLRKLTHACTDQATADLIAKLRNLKPTEICQ